MMSNAGDISKLIIAVIAQLFSVNEQCHKLNVNVISGDGTAATRSSHDVMHSATITSPLILRVMGNLGIISCCLLVRYEHQRDIIEATTYAWINLYGRLTCISDQIVE